MKSITVHKHCILYFLLYSKF